MKKNRYFVVGTENEEMVFYSVEYGFFDKNFLNAGYFIKTEETAKKLLKEIDKSQHPTVKDMRVIRTEIELKVL